MYILVCSIYHFKTSAPNDPKRALSTMRLNVLYICPSSTQNPKFQSVSSGLSLWPAIFELQAILKQVHQKNPSIKCNGHFLPSMYLEMLLLLHRKTKNKSIMQQMFQQKHCLFLHILRSVISPSTQSPHTGMISAISVMSVQ